ncbi:unnamed protein product [Mycena citricolor]|uniref:Major facilitator superfamily (MFS) profile domain-containing protein n=1 Tax=Mycena citricolor TaxID=2018698 RepID=A0AAD2H0J8_9AGAR|nr:unnamed protein product [Mycena citricolor]
MPSEPIEAEFADPPALSAEQEEMFRQLEAEGSPRASLTRVGSPVGVLPSKEVDPHVVMFTPGAGEDPREWSSGRKWYVTITTAFLCLTVALGSSIVTGDLQGPAASLHAQQEVINLSVTCFVIGFGVGPLVLAPLSEVFGRRPIYIISMFFYFIFTLPSALAKNSATLVVARQIAGLAASAPMCNVGGSITDIWSIEQRGIPMAMFSVTVFLGPCLGPIFGGWIGERAGWRWIYWVLFIFTGCVFVFTLFIPETLAPILLQRKAAAMRKETGDSNYRSLAEIEKVPIGRKMKDALTRPLVMMFMEPVVLFMSFYLSFVYALLYLLFFAFPIAFAEVRGFGGGITGTTLVSVAIGIAIAMIFMPRQENIYAKVTKNGTFPEARLYPMLLGSITLPCALFIFAFTGGYRWVNFMGMSVSWCASANPAHAWFHSPGPCVAGSIFGFSMILLYVSANSYIVDSYSEFAASAIAAKTLMRSLVGATVPLFVNQMFHHMGFQYAGLLLALVSVVILPIPFVFYVYGERIRMRSAKASKHRRVRKDVV